MIGALIVLHLLLLSMISRKSSRDCSINSFIAFKLPGDNITEFIFYTCTVESALRMANILSITASDVTVNDWPSVIQFRSD